MLNGCSQQAGREFWILLHRVVKALKDHLVAARIWVNVYSVFDLEVCQTLGLESISHVDYWDANAINRWADIVEGLCFDSDGNRSRDQNDDHLSALGGGMIADLLQGPLRHLKMKRRELSHQRVHMVRGQHAGLGAYLPKEVVLEIDALQLQPRKMKAGGCLLYLPPECA